MSKSSTFFRFFHFFSYSFILSIQFVTILKKSNIIENMISEETKTAILIDIAKGKSKTEICNEYKVSQNTLWAWQERYKDRIENYKQRLTDNFVDSKSASIIRQLEEENTQLKQQIEMLTIEKRALELALETLRKE